MAVKEANVSLSRETLHGTKTPIPNRDRIMGLLPCRNGSRTRALPERGKQGRETETAKQREANVGRRMKGRNGTWQMNSKQILCLLNFDSIRMYVRLEPRSPNRGIPLVEGSHPTK